MLRVLGVKNPLRTKIIPSWWWVFCGKQQIDYENIIGRRNRKHCNIFVKLQAKSLDLELTLFYPCHKNNKKTPHQRLKFDTYTAHGFLAELGVQKNYVTRRTRRAAQITTLTEHAKNLSPGPSLQF